MQSIGDDLDRERAEEYLPVTGANEAVLRQEAAALVAEHWSLVEIIAVELLNRNLLDGDELDILHDIPPLLGGFRQKAPSSVSLTAASAVLGEQQLRVCQPILLERRPDMSKSLRADMKAGPFLSFNAM